MENKITSLTFSTEHSDDLSISDDEFACFGHSYRGGVRLAQVYWFSEEFPGNVQNLDATVPVVCHVDGVPVHGHCAGRVELRRVAAFTLPPEHSGLAVADLTVVQALKYPEMITIIPVDFDFTSSVFDQCSNIQ